MKEKEALDYIQYMFSEAQGQRDAAKREFIANLDKGLARTVEWRSAGMVLAEEGALVWETMIHRIESAEPGAPLRPIIQRYAWWLTNHMINTATDSRSTSMFANAVESYQREAHANALRKLLDILEQMED